MRHSRTCHRRSRSQPHGRCVAGGDCGLPERVPLEVVRISVSHSRLPQFRNPDHETILHASHPAASLGPVAATAPHASVPAIPPGAKLRVVGDVHGDATAFGYAAATDRFLVQLGDLVDYGPDSARTLRIMFDLQNQGVIQIYSVDTMAGAVSASKLAQSDVPDNLLSLLTALRAGTAYLPPV